MAKRWATFAEWTRHVILMGVQHPSGIPDKIVQKMVARRGRLHAFETIEPRSSALVVIDLDVATVGRDNAAQLMIPVVNRLACALRDAGGTVAWVKSRMDAMPKHFAAILGAELAEQYVNEGNGDGPGTMLWHELQPKESDVFAVKSGASAFFPGKCNLKEQLDPRGIDTILVVGAVTNVCCESSARDGAELGYKVILVSDALAGHAHGLHEASYRIAGLDQEFGLRFLTTCFRLFGVPESIHPDSTGPVPIGPLGLPGRRAPNGRVVSASVQDPRASR